MNRIFYHCFTVTIVNLGFALVGAAQTSDPEPLMVKYMESVTVTASRTERKVFESPAAVSIVSDQELVMRAPRAMADALFGTTVVWMQKTNHGGGSPFVRGLTGNQTLILVDGVRLNNATFRYGPNQYFNTLDPWSAGRIEVVRGSGSVLYGSDALGGVINVVTQSPEFNPGKSLISGNAGLKLISQGMEQSGYTGISWQAPNAALSASMNYKNFGDLKAGGDLGFERPSGYDEIGINLNGKFRLGDHWQITGVFRRLNQQDVPRYDQVALRGYQRYSYDPQNHQLGYLRAERTGEHPLFRMMSLLVSYQVSDETRKIRKNNAAILQTEHDLVNTAGLTAQVESQFTPAWNAVTGLEYYYDHIGSEKMEKNLDTGVETGKRGLYPDNSHMASLGLFSHHTLETELFTILLGGRYSRFGIQIPDLEFGEVNLKPQSLVGHASFQLKAGSLQRIILSANTGFRAPNVNDLSTLGLFDYGIEVPATGLSPEKSATVEVGYKLLTPRISGSAFVFHTRLTNQIERVRSVWQGSESLDGQAVYQKQNLSRSAISGLEIETALKVTEALSLHTGFTWLYGENTETYEPMRRIPPANGKAALLFERNRFYLESAFFWATKQTRLSKGDQDDYRIPEGGTPGWTVVNVSGGYNWAHAGIYGGLTNLFNTAYRTHGSGIDGMGRSVWLSVRIKI